MKTIDTIFQLACEIAGLTENFQIVRGTGDGNYATNKFMTKLRSEIFNKLGIDYCEKYVCGKNSFAVDFYIPEENAIIEIIRSKQSSSCSR